MSEEAAELFELDKNKIYFGSTDKLQGWIDGGDQNQAIDRVRQMLKNYLELDNVSFLFGSGSSIHLGAVAIRNFPLEVEAYIKQKDEKLHKSLITISKKIQSKWLADSKEKVNSETKILTEDNGWTYLIEEGIIRDTQSNEIVVELERILNYLIAYNYVLEEDKSKERTDKAKELILAIKEGLFSVVDVDNRVIPKVLIDKKSKHSSEQQNAHAKLLEGDNNYCQSTSLY